MAQDWVAQSVRSKFMLRDASGSLKGVTMYYDPVLEHNNFAGVGMGLGVAFYLLPYAPEVAREMYEG